MSYVFLDESGDLGFRFNRGSSRWFLFTIVVTDHPRTLERVTRKVWRTLRRSHRHIGELHAYHADDVTRRRMLRGISEIADVRILCVVLNKEKVYIDLQNQKNYLYNYTANILMDRLHNRDILSASEPIHLYIDRRDTKRTLRENFVQYLIDAMSDRRENLFQVELHASYENKALQAVDFVSWAIFRKYEQGDYEYYEIIKDKIIEERLLFP